MFTTLFGLAFIANAAIIPAVSTTTNDYAHEKVMEEFAEIPAMIDVAQCESTFRQFEGTSTIALHGEVVPEDRGLFQINEDYHLEDAKEMGIDILTVDDNITYAKVLYLKYGLSPWSASFPCMDRLAQKRISLQISISE